MKVYVEMLADGTVPVKLRVTRGRPFLAELADGGATEVDITEADEYRLFEAELDWGGLDAEDTPPLVVYVHATWVDGDGWTVTVHEDVFNAIRVAAGGIGGGSYFSDVGEDGPGIGEDLVWTNEPDDPDEPQPSTSVYSHLYRRHLEAS